MSPRIERAVAGCLCVGAGFLLAVLAFRPSMSDAQAIRGLGSPAFAGVVSKAGAMTILTTEATNEDLVLVLDGRSEELFVYRTDAREGVQLFQRVNLPRLFAEARLRAHAGG